MFYIVRLFIYNSEAQDKDEPEKSILGSQFGIMIRRLWLGITWPSAVLTLIFGIWTWWLMGSSPQWLVLKLLFVIGLYVYHFSLHMIYAQQTRGQFKFSSQQLRIWNEVATIFLFVVVFMAVGKGSISLPRILLGLIVLIMVLMTGINFYKRIRQRK